MMLWMSEVMFVIIGGTRSLARVVRSKDNSLRYLAIRGSINKPFFRIFHWPKLHDAIIEKKNDRATWREVEKYWKTFFHSASLFSKKNRLWSKLKNFFEPFYQPFVVFDKRQSPTNQLKPITARSRRFCQPPKPQNRGVAKNRLDHFSSRTIFPDNFHFDSFIIINLPGSNNIAEWKRVEQERSPSTAR